MLADVFRAGGSSSKDDPISDRSDQPAQDWKPPGILVSSYTRDDDIFEVWRSSLLDAKCNDIFSAAQILVPLFIEGGTYQDLHDHPWTMERWKVFLL